MSTSVLTPRSRAEAIDWARHQGSSGVSFGRGFCLRACRTAFEVPSDGTPSAAAAADRSLEFHATTSPLERMPWGVLMLWRGGSHGDGHAAISSHHAGLMWSVDVERIGYFDLVESTYPEEHWGLTWAGWSRTIDGRRIKW